ncbi:MAG: nucleotidyltransferase substrate binding protein [Lewinellaceae bacterium]|nr:nucleotidyltransferase substrate binding protein [Saprospiraceae bacterium]MCB9337787.1 nucleotidyltransferase substrate binding protein [Lewinellaceae bacterium]
MAEKDIRWQQRFSSYKKALGQLEKFAAKAEKLSELEEQGLIKSFEYTYELGWNTLKDYLTYQGFADIVGSRDAIRESFRAGLIEDGEGWMDMLKSRNKTSHTYNEETAKQVVEAILKTYFALFKKLESKMENIENTPHPKSTGI